MYKHLLILCVVGSAVSLPAALHAHHAFAAEFDASKPFKIRGTIVKMEWINPHTWLHLDVKRPDGKTERWMIEGGPPNALYRRGFTKASLPQGAELVGIPSVAALETNAARYIAIGDARRDTFYWTEVNEGICVEGPQLLTEAELRERLSTNTLPVFTGELLDVAPDAQLTLPSAAIIARLAAADRGIVARGDLEPIYLREPHITQPKRATIPLPHSASRRSAPPAPCWPRERW